MNQDIIFFVMGKIVSDFVVWEDGYACVHGGDFVVYFNIILVV